MHAAAAAPTRGSCSKTDEIPGPSFRACLNKASQSRHGGGGAVASPRGDVVGGVCGREATAACCYCSTTVLLLVALVSLGNFLSVFSPLHTSTTTLWPVLKILVPKLKFEIQPLQAQFFLDFKKFKTWYKIHNFPSLGSKNL